jgi:hypothetical protein
MAAFGHIGTSCNLSSRVNMELPDEIRICQVHRSREPIDPLHNVRQDQPMPVHQEAGDRLQGKPILPCCQEFTDLAQLGAVDGMDYRTEQRSSSLSCCSVWAYCAA